MVRHQLSSFGNGSTGTRRAPVDPRSDVNACENDVSFISAEWTYIEFVATDRWSVQPNGLPCACCFRWFSRSDDRHAVRIKPSAAQTDEIQVYTGEINKPGEFSVTLHNNFTPSGRTQPDFPGGIVPNHALNGVPEYAYGMTDWWEVGAYAPVYTLTNQGALGSDSVKLRTLFAVPHAGEHKFF